MLALLAYCLYLLFILLLAVTVGVLVAASIGGTFLRRTGETPGRRRLRAVGVVCLLVALWFASGLVWGCAGWVFVSVYESAGHGADHVCP